MDTFRDALDTLIRTRGMQYSDLARRVGVTKSYIGQLVHGHSKPPPRERVRQLAEVLGLAADEREALMDLAVRERARPEARDKIEKLSAALRDSQKGATPLEAQPGIPVIGNVAAGQTSVAFTDAGLPVGACLPGEEPIPRWPGVGDHAYALRITGDSMTPLCPQGTTIVIDPDRTPRPGEPAICQTTDGKSYFKIVQFEAGGYVRLISTNPAVAPDIVVRRAEIRRLQKVIATLYL